MVIIIVMITFFYSNSNIEDCDFSVIVLVIVIDQK